jgi:hypothetical protein
MANFHFTVDTSEMADSLNRVSAHVEGTTAAVVGMQAAVVAAEMAASKQICDHVNYGIFSLIRSQLTQKMAVLRSQAESRILEMRQQTQSLLAIKSRMERDYQMIASRYARLFQSINASLRSRVFELDKAVSNLVYRDLVQIANRAQSLQARVPVNQLESVAATQAVAAVQAKNNAGRAMQRMQSFVASSHAQSRLMKSILFEANPPRPALLSIPVVFTQLEGLTVNATEWNARYPCLPASGEDTIRARAFAALSAFEWRPASPPVRQRVTAEYSRMLDRAQISDRVKQQMRRLFEDSQWSEIQERQS